MLRLTGRLLGCSQPARKGATGSSRNLFSSSPLSAEVPSTSSVLHQNVAIEPSSERSPEQEKAAKLEHEGMLKMTDQVLSLKYLNSSNIRDFKLALNYWTSVRASHQQGVALISQGDEFDKQRMDQQMLAAPRLFEALIERGDSSFIQQTVKTDENSMGGLIYLIEHLLFAFRESHQLKLLSAGKNKQQASTGDRDELLTALMQASNVLITMHRLQIDPDFPDITADTNSVMPVKLMEINLWSKRVWFLKRFGGGELTDDQIELAFGGERTIENCITALSCLADELILLDPTNGEGNVDHLLKVYTMLISAWVHSGLSESLATTLDLINDMEEDERVAVLSSIPYNSVMYLCGQQQAPDTATEVALPLWQHMRAPDSDVQPDATTLATLLVCLITSNQLREATAVLDEVEGEQGRFQLQTNTMCYNILLDGLAKSGRNDAARDAEALLRRMTELSETGSNHAVAPDRISFSIVMELLSNQGNYREVEDVLMRCKAMAETNAELEPDRIMYNIVLDSYAKQSHNDRNHQYRRATAPQQAEKLLRMMENTPNSLPTTISYNSVLNVFAKSGVPFERMNSILNEMNSKAASGDESVKPDIITYNIVLGAIARDGSKESMDKGLAFMQEMRDIGMEPDRITFNNLMDSIIKADRPGAAVLAESILDKMDSEHGIQPDASSYNVILNGFAKVGSAEAAQRAEHILQTMVTLHQEDGRVDCRPDFVSYTSVMDAYARSRGADAGFQADALLASMVAADIVPNTICYNAAINCWAKSRHLDAPVRAESILNRMTDEELQNPSAKPNSVSFSTVMNCWAQSGQPGAAEKTDALLGRMELLLKAGNHNMLPNPYTYSTVISAWGKVGRSDKALEILNRVEKAFTSGMSSVRPNFACYNAAINAVAKSRSENKAEEAVAILERMKYNFHELGLKDTAPTTISYSSVLNACAYTISKEPERRANAFRIARETFRELLQIGKPTSVCYINFLSACGRLLPSGKKRLDMAEAIFCDCQERGLMDGKVESTYQGIVSRSQFSPASNRAPVRPSWRSR